MAGSTHSIPTSAPGMYDYTNVHEPSQLLQTHR